jgi:hypothetical protein
MCHIAIFPGANPTIVSYNASAVKIYNTTSSLVRFENKNILFFLDFLEKSCSLLHVGLAPGHIELKGINHSGPSFFNEVFFKSNHA